MRVLLDHCAPKRLRRLLADHEVKTAYQMGWEKVKNGKLLTLAQTEFDVFLTVDQNLAYQQNLEGRSLAVIVLVAPNNKVETLAPLMLQVEALLAGARPGQLYQVAAQEEAGN